MIAIPLFKRSMISGIKIMLPFIAILTMYNTIIIWMYDPKLSESLKEFQDIMPQMMAAVGMMGTTSTMIEFVNTYLYGFIMLFVPVIYIIMLVNRLIVYYVDSGSIACLLATPNPRRKLIFTQLLTVGILTAALIVVTAGIGFVCSQAMFPGELAVKTYIELNGAVILFDWAVGGSVYLPPACSMRQNGISL